MKLETSNLKLLLPSPAQLVAQHVEIISIHWLHQIECRVALSDEDAVVRVQRQTDLAIKRQRHVFVFSLQTQLDQRLIGHHDWSVGKCERTDWRKHDRVHR